MFFTSEWLQTLGSFPFSPYRVIGWNGIKLEGQFESGGVGVKRFHQLPLGDVHLTRSQAAEVGDPPVCSWGGGSLSICRNRFEAPSRLVRSLPSGSNEINAKSVRLAASDAAIHNADFN